MQVLQMWPQTASTCPSSGTQCSSGSPSSLSQPERIYGGVLTTSKGTPSGLPGLSVHHATRMRKSSRVVLMMFLMLLPVVILLGFILYYVSQATEQMKQLGQLQSDLSFCLSLGHLVKNLQQERDAGVLELSADSRHIYMLPLYEGTEASFGDLPNVAPKSMSDAAGIGTYSLNSIKVTVWKIREEVNLADNSSRRRQTAVSYTTLINSLQRLQLNTILRVKFEQLWKLLVAYYKLINTNEAVAVQLQAGSEYLLNGTFETGKRSAFIESSHLVGFLLTTAARYLPQDSAIYEQLMKNMSSFRWLDPGIAYDDIIVKRLSLPPQKAVVVYYDEITSFRSYIFNLHIMLSEAINKEIVLHDRYSGHHSDSSAACHLSSDNEVCLCHDNTAPAMHPTAG